MNAVIERLRASKTKQVDEVIKAGFDAGRNWAEEDASYNDLRAVGLKVMIPNEPDEVEYNFLTNVLDKPTQPHDFWEVDMENSALYRIGFAKGAQAVWNEVSDKL